MSPPRLLLHSCAVSLAGTNCRINAKGSSGGFCGLRRFVPAGMESTGRLPTEPLPTTIPPHQREPSGNGRERERKHRRRNGDADFFGPRRPPGRQPRQGRKLEGVVVAGLGG